MTSLSVLILSWNQVDLSLRCVDRILAWRRLRPTIWVVDNASRDESVARISQRQEVRLLASSVNLGFGGGNNLALREIDDDVVMLLNNDAIVEEEGVISLIETLEAHPEIAVIGPLLKAGCGSGAVVTAGGRDISRHIGTHVRFDGAVTNGRIREVDYVPGTVALLRTGSLARVGLFDEDYFFSGEMADLCERLRADGGTSAVLTSVTAEHDTARAGEQRSTLYAYYSLRNRFLFIRKFRRRILVPMLGFWVSYSLFFVLRAALTGRWHVARVGALALADGLRGHFDGQNQRIAGPDLNAPSDG